MTVSPAVRALRPVAWLGTLNGLAVLLLLLLGSAVVSLALRYRRGDQRLRQQMKWLGLAFAGVLACQAVGALSIAAGQENKPLQTVPYVITPFLVYFGIPAAMAIAILRRRLFDIDVIISRALLVTLLSAGVTAVYAAIVLGIGALVGSDSDPLLTIAAAVVIALVFQPLRQRASLLTNRLVYGHRATPYQVLSDFAADMAGQLDLGDALDRMVRLYGSAGALEFSVSDDGAGFPAGTSHGSGLQGMSDRLAAHGGTLTVRSRPGQGTTITGRLPTSERTAAAGFPVASPG